MKDYLKYIAWMVVAIVVLVLVLKISGWIEGSPHIDYTVTTPIDSGFAPIIKKDFKPRSTPFERPSKPPVRLPKGVKEADVKRVIVITERLKTDSGTKFFDSTAVVELKSGEIYVPKEDGKELTVEEFRYVPPILDFGLFASVGASIGRSQQRFNISPLLAASPLQICGSVQFPLLMADLQGVGAGFGIRYGDFMVGISSHWNYLDAQRQIKVSIHYSIN